MPPRFEYQDSGTDPLTWDLELSFPTGGGICLDITMSMLAVRETRMWYTVRLDMPTSLRDILNMADLIVRVEGQRDS